MRASLFRFRHALVMGVIFCPAPSPAQTLVPAVGEPIAFRVHVPAGATVTHEDGNLYADAGDTLVIATAVDAAADEFPNPTADQRREVTERFMAADSLLLAFLQRAAGHQEMTNAVMGIHTMGGERAGYLRGDIVEDGEAGVMEFLVTVKDGIIYMVMVGLKGADEASFRPLADAIQESFVLADAPED